jgi:hypothetical protein
MIVNNGEVMIWNTAAQEFLPGSVGSISGGLTAPGANGLVVHTGGGATAARSLAQPGAGFTISNNNGVSGNPTFIQPLHLQTI